MLNPFPIEASLWFGSLPGDALLEMLCLSESRRIGIKGKMGRVKVLTAPATPVL